MSMDQSSDSEDETCVIVPREAWSARPPRGTKPLNGSVSDVIYTETDTRKCDSREDCSRLINEIQNFHMDVKGLPDIQYNFLIGGDGSVYEGRGWETAGPDYPKSHFMSQNPTSKSIEVAFIGQYKDEEPSDVMIKASSKLIQNGVKNNFIVHDNKEVSKKSKKEAEEEEYEDDNAQGKDLTEIHDMMKGDIPEHE